MPSSRQQRRPLLPLLLLLIGLLSGCAAAGGSRVWCTVRGGSGGDAVGLGGVLGLADEIDMGGDASGSSEVTTGTVLVAAKFKDGVVLGADSRSVKGGRYVQDRATDKLLPVGEHVCLACSGKAAVVQRVGQEIANRLRFFQIKHQREPTPRTAAALLRILLRRGLAPQSAGGTAGTGGDDNQSHLTVGMDADAIAAGWHPQEGPSVYQVLAGGTVLEAKDYAVSGSGASYVVGFLDLNYPTHDTTDAPADEGKGAEKKERLGRGRRHTVLSREEAEEMVQKALALAVGRDTHSGGPVTLAVIDAGGVQKRVVGPKELEAALKKGNQKKEGWGGWKK